MRASLTGPVHVFAAVALLSAGAIVLYFRQFVDTNAYIGIGELPFHRIEYWWLMAVWLLSVALVMPARPRAPSDVFLCLYVVGCALWSASYWPATGMLDVGGAAVLMALLITPAVAVQATQAMAARSQRSSGRWLALFGRSRLMPLILALLVLASLLGYRVAGGDAGFSFDEAANRRLQGRETFSGNALAAYLLQMSANGLAPFVAFLGMLRRSRVAVVLALGFAVLCFWLLGLKSPLVNVLALTGLGWLLRSGRIGSVTAMLTGALAFVLALSLLELRFFDVSLIAEFGVRRVILVNATIQSYFVDALAQTSWLPLLTSGFDLAGHLTPEYYIGATYMGSELTNANTNAFLHELAVNGVLGYLAVVAGVCAVLAWCDRVWWQDGRADGFAFAAILGILMVEQAFTTALISSGLVLCILLSTLFAKRSLASSNPLPAL